MRRRPRRTEVVEHAATTILEALQEQIAEHQRTAAAVRKWLTDEGERRRG